MSETLIGIFLTLGILLVIILSVPIHLEFSGEYAEIFNLKGRLRWAGGLLSIEIIRSKGMIYWSFGCLGLKKSKPKKRKTTPGKDARQAAKKKKRANAFGNLSSFLNPQLFAAVKTLLLKLIKALHLNFNLAGTYGFDDPSLTGFTVGLLAALNTGGRSIDLDPDFTREVVDIRGRIRGWFSPLKLMAIGAVFLLKKPVRAIWWSKIRFHKKQKEAVQYA